MTGEKLSYFNRRAAQERAAAEAAASKAAAEIHLALAKRFDELASNEAIMDEPLMDATEQQMEMRPD